MSLSSIIKLECPTHKRVIIEVSRTIIGSTVLVKAACGCVFPQKNFTSAREEILFENGKSPKEYQYECLSFAEKAGFNLIIGDEQGLGKTIEFLMLIHKHAAELLPAICVVPTTVKLQWMHEVINFLGKSRFRVQVINSTKEMALPGFDIYFTTYDMIKSDQIFSLINANTLMMDECQRIKNHLSDRAKAVQKLRKNVKYCIPMSGTPIKNHAGEYFTILNLVAPTRFPNYSTYLDKYCDTYDGGYGTKVGGLSNPERFHEDTKDLIIRRTKDQVMKDLPPLERRFFHVELDRKLNKAYDKALEDLEEALYGEDAEGGFGQATAIIAIMSRMRHITGQSKVEQCIEFTTEFLLSSERKLTIFTHHKDVADMLVYQLNQWCKEGGFAPVLNLHSGLSADGRANLIENFKSNASSRILIAATLAAGEGLNIQFCSDAVMLERQWNPANEEQAEARFHRFGQVNNVSVTYMLASGTIDDYFTELVEAKRAIVSSTLDNKQIDWNEQSLMKELAQTLVARGRKKWSL